MNRIFSKLTTIILIVAAIVIGYKIFFSPTLLAAVGPEDERPLAPDFKVFDGQGQPVLLSQKKGQPVIVNFWASWCPYCRQEMADFNAVFKEEGQNIAFMMVDLVDGQRETLERGRKYIEENKFEFPVYYDTEQSAAQAYGINTVPTTVFIDKEGRIMASASGPLDAATLRKAVGIIKAEDQVAPSPSAQPQKITGEKAHQMMGELDKFIVLDVRTQKEFDERRVAGAILIPYNEIGSQGPKLLPDKDTPIFVYCRTGRRSAIAAADLAKQGYSRVYDFGALSDWKFEVEP